MKEKQDNSLEKKGKGSKPKTGKQKLFSPGKGKPKVSCSQPNSPRRSVSITKNFRSWPNLFHKPFSSEKSGLSASSLPAASSELPETDIEIKELEKKLYKPVGVQLGLTLDLLIPENKFPELWRSTLTYKEKMSEKSKAFVKRQTVFPWHTKQSLDPLAATCFMEKTHAIKANQIAILEQFFDGLLDPVFQKYLQEEEAELEQAWAVCEYFREKIAVLMTTNIHPEQNQKDYELFESLKAFYSSFSRAKDLTQLAVNQLASFKVQDLRLLEQDSLDIPGNYKELWSFLCRELARTEINELSKGTLSQYNSLLLQLVEWTRLSMLSMLENQKLLSKIQSVEGEKAKVISLSYDGVEMNFVSLRSLLPEDEALRKAIISKLVLALSEEQGLSAHRRDPHKPVCYGDEQDFFIPDNGQLKIEVKKSIEDSMDMFSTLNKRFFKTMTTRIVEGLAKKLLQAKNLELSFKEEEADSSASFRI